MEKAEKFAGTDRCVKCGLCLPHCPTYVKTSDENESPRGRLALIQAWSKDALPASAGMKAHLDNCLLCRSCERVCPAQVPYGQLMDDFRSTLPSNHADAPLGSRIKTGVLKHIVDDRSRLRKARRLLGGVAGALEKTGLGRLQAFQELRQINTREQSEWQEFYPARGQSRGTVALFVGCMGELVDTVTVNATIHVLTAMGFDLSIPGGQTCCGALALHEGQGDEAREMAMRNLQAFDGDYTAIVSLASGCGSTLLEYNERLEEADASHFSTRVLDISSFIAQQSWPEDLPLQSLDKRAVLHTPCTLKNVMRQEAGALRVLSMIPHLQVRPLPATTLCCGAAGSYMLEHPEMSGMLRSDVLDLVNEQPVEYLLTSNIGCAIHLATGLAGSRSQVEVLHPVTLLARQLGS